MRQVMVKLVWTILITAVALVSAAMARQRSAPTPGKCVGLIEKVDDINKAIIVENHNEKMIKLRNQEERRNYHEYSIETEISYVRFVCGCPRVRCTRCSG